MGYSDLDPAAHDRRPWNAGQNIGPKRPLKPRDIWAIRFYLDEHRRLRDRALFDLAIDSKLRGCDLVKLKIGNVVSGAEIRNRSTVIQQKTGRLVQFEIMSEARKSLTVWLERRRGNIPFSPAVWTISATWAHGNMLVWSMNGFRPSAWIGASPALIHYAERRLPSSTRQREICEPSRYCSATPTLKTPCAILESISTTH